MPFQSEKQRRYMHANLPDIAKRWERDYAGGGIAELNQELNSLPEYYMPFPAAQGGLIPAHEAGIYGLAEGGRTGFYKGSESSGMTIQGGVKNYLGNQEVVNAPKYWKSGLGNPDTELAYITTAEKDLILKKDLHGSLKDGPNEGPSGIISLDSQGDRPTPDSPASTGGGGGDEPSWGGESYDPPSAPPAETVERDNGDAREKYISEQYKVPKQIDDPDYDEPDRAHEKLTQREIKQRIKELKSSDQYGTRLTREQKKQVNAELAAHYGDKPGTKYDLSDWGADKAWGQKKSGFWDFGEL